MNIFQNKSILIHITCEIIIIGVTIYWIKKKNKYLQDEINMLNNKIFEQDKIIKQHASLINQLFGIINNQNTNQNNTQLSNDNNKFEIKSKNILGDDMLSNLFEKDVETESQLDKKIEKELKELEDDE